jgi:rSAM/selenodomain-associated transferase 1
MNASPVSIAVLAKAPIPGFANTRLIAAIGAQAAAVLQERMTERAVATAIEANIGPVTLWGAPDAGHDTFLKMVVRQRIALRPQPAGDLGARMLAATAAGHGPVLVIGTDCPALTPVHLRGAARALRDEGADVVLIPAEDGGYVLIGTRTAQPQLFSGIAWSTPSVLAQTRARVIALRLRLAELPPLWDVDTEADLARMEREHPELAL